jgi:hypothetical protein
VSWPDFMTPRRARRDARRKPEPRTEPLQRLRTAAYDATTIEFTGASGTGLPDGIMQPSEQAETGILYMDAEPTPRTIGTTPRDTGPLQVREAAQAPGVTR